MDSDNNVTSREFMWRDVCLNVEQKEKYQNLFFLPNVTCHTVVIINNVLGDSVNWWVLSKLEKSKLEPNKLFFDNSKWCFLRFSGFFHIIFISWRNSSSALFLWSMFMLLDVTGNISFFVVDEFSKSLHMSQSKAKTPWIPSSGGGFGIVWTNQSNDMCCCWRWCLVPLFKINFVPCMSNWMLQMQFAM
jgi:hypothetical protein